MCAVRLDISKLRRKVNLLAINVQCLDSFFRHSEHYVFPLSALFLTTSSDSKVKGSHYQCALVYYHYVADPQNGCAISTSPGSQFAVDV